MRNLLNKEFKLVITPLYFVMLAFGVLVLIPQWPYFIAMMYFLFISLPNIFTAGKAQNDIGYSVLLPVARRDIVKARIMSISIMEAAQILVTSIFCVINSMIYKNGNGLLDANIAFLGLSFVMYGISNLLFFTLFYKTSYKIAFPVIAAVIAALVFAGAVEIALIFIPAIRIIDGWGNIGAQLLVLAGGILIFIAANYIAFKVSAKRFEEIDV